MSESMDNVKLSESHESLSTELAALQDKLDTLWERYLVQLDLYDHAQRKLSKQLSAGFFSLTQANFTATSRTRYGQDHYDERMQAVRRIKVLQQTGSDSGDKDAPLSASVRLVDNEDLTTETDIGKDANQQPTPPATPLPSGTHDDEDDATANAAEKHAQSEHDTEPGAADADGATTSPDAAAIAATKKLKDPLRWFGILVPPSLRACQATFVSVVEDSVGIASDAAREMRRVEGEIRRVRKEVRRAEKRVKEVSVS